MEIKNSVAIVTGAASGIGAATAQLLIEAGAKVALLDKQPNSAKQGLVISCDITDEKSTEAALKQIEEQLGIARICINCAGILKTGRIVGKKGPYPLSDFKQILEVNLIGTYNMMRLTAARMATLEPLGESNERGVIINTASIAGIEGQVGQTAYSASKGGIIALTLPAARDLAPLGIRVVAIAPGLFDTPILSNLTPTALDELVANIPFPKRLGNPREYAKLAQHIIDNPLINGEIIRLDGGLRLP